MPVVLYAGLQLHIVLGPDLLVSFVSYDVHRVLSVLLVFLLVLVVCYVVLLVPTDLRASFHAFVVLCVDGRPRGLCIQTSGCDEDKMVRSPFLRLLS